MINILEEYLCKIGFDVDSPSFQKFGGVLVQAERAATQHTGGIIQAFSGAEKALGTSFLGIARKAVEVQGSIGAAFGGMSASVLGLVDHVAMADQSYRLMGASLMMSGAEVRKMTFLTKALGASMEEIVWDPTGELGDRMAVLSRHYDEMAKNLGPDFEGNMRSIRDVRAELGRLGMDAEFLGMSFASQLWKKISPGDPAKQLDQWITELEGKLPGLSGELSAMAAGGLRDTWHMAKEAGGALKETGLAFTNLVGLFSGDKSIEGTTFSFHKLAGAIEHVEHGAVRVFDAIVHGEKVLADFASGTALLFGGRYADAAIEFDKARKDLTRGSGAALGLAGGAGAGGAIGAALGAPLGPLGVAAGGALGVAAGGGLGAAGGAIVGKAATETGERPTDFQKLADYFYANRQSDILGAAAGFLLGGPLGALAGEREGTKLQEIYDSQTPRKPQSEQSLSLFDRAEVLAATWADKWFGPVSDTLARSGATKAGSPLPPQRSPLTIVPLAHADAPSHAASPSAQPAAQPAPSLIDLLAAAIETKEMGKDPNSVARRNHNFGNLRRWEGFPVKDGYAEFPDDETGIAKLRKQIELNISRGLSLYEFFAGKEVDGKKTYPGFAPADDGNDPAQYAAQVAKRLGIDATTPLNQVVIPAPPPPASTPVKPIAYFRDGGPRPFTDVAPAFDGSLGWRRQAVSSPVSNVDYVDDRLSRYTDGAPALKMGMMDMDWSGIAAYMQRPTDLPQANSTATTAHFNNTIGDIAVHVTQPGADARQIARQVAKEVRNALDEQTRQDSLQLTTIYG